MKKQESRATLGARFLQRKWIRAALLCCVLLTAAAIFLFSAQEGEASGRASDAIVRFVISTVEGSEPAVPLNQLGAYPFVSKLVRKTAHFAEFALLGFFLRLLAGACALKRPTRRCWLAGTLYACTDEVHQLLVADRAGLWQDVLLDACGVLAGITCAYALLVILWRAAVRFGGKKHEQA